MKNPSYREVCNGTTGHAEVCKIVYDPEKISYEELLAAFWKSHDPTQLNRQGNDIGTQYRSVIFYTNDTQKQLAEKYKKEPWSNLGVNVENHFEPIYCVPKNKTKVVSQLKDKLANASEYWVR